MTKSGTESVTQEDPREGSDPSHGEDEPKDRNSRGADGARNTFVVIQR